LSWFKQKRALFRNEKARFIFEVIFVKKKMASDLHRTATTIYLCCVPTLEDSTGAGRVGLAFAKV